MWDELLPIILLSEWSFRGFGMETGIENLGL